MTLSDEHAASVALYRREAVDAANAEAAYKKAYAKRKLEAMHSGDAKSVAMAELIADAEDDIADLLSKRLISAALADSTKQRILSLRTEIEMERSKMADRRFEDQFHARDRNVP